MTDIGRLLVKMVAFRGLESRGPGEFRYRWRRGDRQFHRIDILARDGGFRSSVVLRRGTSDVPVFEQVFVSADYNLRRLRRWPEIVDRYRYIAQVGTPLILDLGANIGCASLYLTKNFPEARILALEPEPGNFRQLCMNLRGHSHVLPLQAAVASSDGAVCLENPVGSDWAFRTRLVTPASTGVVPARSVSTLLGRSPECTPFLAKIDIEGFEDELFSRNLDWVDRFPILIIELHDWLMPRQGKAGNFLRAVQALERDFVILGESICSIAQDLARAATTVGGSPK